jgi:hypothetical protein
VVAPGVDVLGGTLFGGYKTYSGTGYATAFVSAAVALLKSAAPALPAAAVVRRLLATASPSPGGGRGSAYGAGVVDPYRAVTETVSDRAPVKAAPLASPVVDPAALRLAERRARATDRARLALIRRSSGRADRHFGGDVHSGWPAPALAAGSAATGHAGVTRRPDFQFIPRSVDDQGGIHAPIGRFPAPSSPGRHAAAGPRARARQTPPPARRPADGRRAIRAFLAAEPAGVHVLGGVHVEPGLAHCLAEPGHRGPDLGLGGVPVPLQALVRARVDWLSQVE